MITALAALAAPALTVSTTVTAPPRIVAVAAPAKQGSADSVKKKGDVDFAKMMAMFDKLFPPQPDPDPARLTAARGVAQHMWPDGTYGMLLDSFVGSMANTVLDLKPADLAMLEEKGKKDAPAAADANLSLRDKMRRDDPHFDQRLGAITTAIRGEFARMSPLIEPPLREGLSRALARRFTEAQLADLDSFYKTPTGQAFAKETLKIWFDGDVVRSTMSSMPALMLQLPGAMQRVEAAAKSFPPPPKKPKAGGKSKP